MNNLKTLIEQHCPDGVEYRELGNIYDFKYGTGNTIPTIGGKYPVYGSNGIVGMHNDYNSEDSPVIGHIGTYAGIVNWGSGKHFVTYNGVMCKIKKDIVIPRYGYYLLLHQDFISMAHSGSQPFVSYNMLESVKIPLPPLSIQQEIVNILDKFNQLQAEIEAELVARRKQYEYYRNELIKFEDDKVERKTLGEIGEFIRGKRFVKNDITSEGVPCIHYGEMYTHYKIWAREAKSYLEPTLAAKLRVAHTGDVIIVAAGETVEDIGNGLAWLGESDVVIHDACFAFSHNLNPKYVSYYLHTDLFRSQIKRYISSGKISSINASGLSKAIIPIPPLAEQERIVGILDKFDKLINDISEGLPPEIEARRKQYEYYRGKLLDFKNVNNG